ncbi:hypothetical protein ACQP1U_06910 [Actinomycetota bacterium]
MSERTDGSTPEPDNTTPDTIDSTTSGFDMGGLPGGDATLDTSTEPPTDILAAPQTAPMPATDATVPSASEPPPVGPPPGAVPVPESPAAQPFPQQPGGSQPYPVPGQQHPAQQHQWQPDPGQPYPGQPYPGQQYANQAYPAPPGQPATGPGTPAQPPRPWETGAQPQRSGVRPGCVAGIIGAILALGVLLTAFVVAMRNLTANEPNNVASTSSSSSSSVASPSGGKASTGATPLGGPATALPEKGRTVRLEVVSTGGKARVTVMKNSDRVTSAQDEIALPYVYEMPFTTGESDRFSIYANPSFDEKPRPTMECRVYLDGVLVVQQRSRDYGVSCNFSARDIIPREY